MIEKDQLLKEKSAQNKKPSYKKSSTIDNEQR